MTDPDDPKLSYIALDKVASAQGMVNAYHNAWWSVHPERGIMIYRKHSPQCNSNEAISRRLSERCYPWAEVRQIPLVLIPVDPRDYV